jgi:hypothetical protein
MALHWQWDEKCGEATLVQMYPDEEDREFKLGLYTGNACLIMLSEWEEDGESMWNMFSFWADKDHMKNCLGLNKKQGYTDNMYATPYQKITKVKLNKKKCRYFKDIVAALAQAFDDLTIEVVSE